VIDADTLHLISQQLAKFLQQRDPILEELKKQINEIYASSEYQKWLAEDQFYADLDLKGRFRVPDDIANGDHERRRLLDKFELVVNDFLTVKIDKHGDRLHLTDGLWAPPDRRVFPFSDESELLVRYAREHGIIDGTDVLVDPACGCGHHGLALDGIGAKISLDINLRAIAYCRINTILNGSQSMLLGVNDITQGLPVALSDYLGGKVLFLINMPFAIYPSSKDRSLSQDGGDRGIELTLAALSAVNKFQQANTWAKEIRAVVLAYSLGRSLNGPWDLVERAQKMFEKSKTPCEVKFELAGGEQMWRVNGRKEQANPMHVSKLKLKAGCRFSYPAWQEEKITEGYRALENNFLREGFEYLGYGMMDIKVR
jgi:hypothetical protein